MGSRKATRTRKTATETTSKAYPFVSKSEVRERLASDGDFVLTCMRIMEARTEEREAGRAPRAHRWGWSSADAAQGARALAERLLRGQPVRGDKTSAAKLLAKYTVQIAEALRLREMSRKPELIDTAKVYGVAPPRRRRGKA